MVVFGFATQVLAANAAPAAAAVQKHSAEVSIPNSQRIDFVSKVNGHRYSLTVAFPYEKAPAQGYGVLYVIDGNWYFGSATEAVRNWNAPDVVVVAIGYPDDPAFTQEVLRQRGPVPPSLKYLPPQRQAPFMERSYDLTLPATDQELAAQTPAGTPPEKSQNVGGMDAYLKMIETDVKPRIAALVSVDPKNQALFGDSLGGLTTLHALFTEPNAFRTFIIGSPSIWWNNRSVLADREKFAAAVSSGQASPRVIVTMGSEESTPPKVVPARWGTDAASLAELLRKDRMVENGNELVTWLKTIHGGPGYVVDDYAVFDKLDHGAASWAALARGVRFAFSTTP